MPKYFSKNFQKKNVKKFEEDFVKKVRKYFSKNLQKVCHKIWQNKNCNTIRSLRVKEFIFMFMGRMSFSHFSSTTKILFYFMFRRTLTNVTQNSKKKSSKIFKKASKILEKLQHFLPKFLRKNVIPEPY